MERFSDYLSELGIVTETLLSKINEHLNVCQMMCPEEIEELFISDFRNEENQRKYGPLLFLSQNFVLEVKNPFSKSCNYDIASFTKTIPYAKIESSDFNFSQQYDENSRLKLSYIYDLSNEIVQQAAASGVNCVHLWNLYLERLKPHLRREV